MLEQVEAMLPMGKFAPFKSDQEIAAIGEGFLDRTLSKTRWTHQGHFAATLWLIECRSDLALPRDLPPLIQAYNSATGGINSETAGYHETITQASIRAARHFSAMHADLPLFERCNALMASALGNSGWMLEYWSAACLLSVMARQRWVEADLKPFPYPIGDNE